MSYLRLFLILFPCLYLVFWLFILFRFVSNHLFAQTGQLDFGVFVCWESACLAEQSCVSTSRLVAKCENSMQTLQNRICVSLSVRLRCLAAHLYLWSAQAQRCTPSENISEEHAIHATQIYLQEKEKEKVIKILGTHHLGSINVCSVQIHLSLRYFITWEKTLSCWQCQRKCQGITKVSYPRRQWILKRLHNNPSSSCQDISVWT